MTIIWLLSLVAMTTDKKVSRFVT